MNLLNDRKMKKVIFLTFILSLTSINLSVFAQHEDKGRKERFEKFQKERIDYISKEMNLTEEEGSVFWPLCDELQMKKFELNKPLRNEMMKLRKGKENKIISDADYKKLIELGSDIRIKEAQLEKEYFSKFVEVIPAEKVFIYQKAERDFGKQMMEKRKRASQDKN